MAISGIAYELASLIAPISLLSFKKNFRTLKHPPDSQSVTLNITNIFNILECILVIGKKEVKIN